MKKILMFLSGFALAVGCASTGGLATARFFGQHVTVQIDSDIPFPEEMTLTGFDLGDRNAPLGLANEIFGKMTGITLKRRVSDLVAGRTQPYGEMLTESFREKIREGNIFGAVVAQGGDVVLKLDVIRYGLTAINGDLKDLKPVLDIRARLVAPVVGVVWQDTFDVPEYSTRTLSGAVSKILNGESLFSDLYKSASDAAAEELVRRMH